MVKKSLGQHWLFDEPTLQAVVKAAEITKNDTVLEIGPGLGSLTELLVVKSKQVIAVEKDEQLAVDLNRRLTAANLEVVTDDILQYDPRQLPPNYKVAGNIPYYITSNLLRLLMESPNPPHTISLLLQKEVAQRIVANPGKMSILALSVQYYAEAKLIQVVRKELFTPPPKVDSAIVQIKRRPQPSFEANPKKLFRLIKAGFSEKRKQLKNALAGGLGLSLPATIELLENADVDSHARAQELGLKDWKKLYEFAEATNII